MRTSFGRFELDEAGRTLRLDGVEQALQPLVFDLLVYLVAHRDRVVPKEELLAKVWAGVHVTDASLQRAISLLRTVLREGGLPDAVQTFARRGYRFGDAPVESPAVTSVDAAEDSEALGNEVLCAGQPEHAVEPLERAVAAYEARGDREAAARVCLLLTNLKLEGRELAIAKGWHRRARTLLVDVPEGSQHGMAEWLEARFALFEGRLDECDVHAQEALAIAQRVNDADLRCLGLVYHGHVLLARGDARQGLALHDEAGVAALAGSVGTWVSGVVFCSVIWAYLHLGDHHRAGQWSDEFARWCERFPAYSYPALCRLHRGEVLAQRGELTVAEDEVQRARVELATSGPFTEGDAWRVLGDIRLARGELDDAEAAFRESHRLGWNPQPGLAQLFHARGLADAAIKQLERAIAEPGWTDGQRGRILATVLARIAAMSGRLERARSALATVDALSESSVTPASSAELARARGELAWAEGDLQGAEPLLRRSVAEWLKAGARVHAAHVRLRLCEALLAADDPTAAELELSAAEAVFAEVGAEPMRDTCRRLRTRFPPGA